MRRTLQVGLLGLGVLLGIGFPSALGAQTIQIVKHGQSQVLVPSAPLTGMPQAQASALVWTDPAYGSVERRPDGFLYQPDADFWAAGYDSFQFSYDDYVTTRNTVFLIADLKGSAFGPGIPGACGFGEGWSIVGDPANYRIINQNNTSTSCIVEFLLGSNTLVYIESADSQTGPGGGNTSITLDPGGHSPVGDLSLEEGVDLPIVAGVLADGRPVFELLMRDGPELLLRAHRGDGTFVSSNPFPITEEGQRVELNWWFATAAGSADGGLTLSLGDQMVSAVHGIDNFGLIGFDWNWRFGVAGNTGAASGVLHFSLPEVWVSPEQLVFKPLFAESAGSQSVKGWSKVLGAQQVTVSSADPEKDPEFIIRLQGSSGPVAFQDDSPHQEVHYRARFTLGLASVSRTSGPPWTLFYAGDLGKGTPPFRVQTRHHPTSGALQIRVQANALRGSVTSPWFPIAANSQRTDIEVQWWAAKTSLQPNGGLRLWVDGTLAGALSNLDNFGQRINETLLGALETPLGMGGSLVVDDFFVWH